MTIQHDPVVDEYPEDSYQEERESLRPGLVVAAVIAALLVLIVGVLAGRLTANRSSGSSVQLTVPPGVSYVGAKCVGSELQLAFTHSGSTRVVAGVVDPSVCRG